MLSRLNTSNLPKTLKIAKTGCRIATWNIRTILKPEARHLLADNLKSHWIDIVCTRNGDSRWHSRDTSRFLCWAQLQNVCLWLRETSSARSFGMYLRLTNNLMELKACGPRLCYMRLDAVPVAISLICTYAPTEDSSESDKEKNIQNYKHASKTCLKDVLSTGGDFNAKVCLHLVGVKQSIGPFSDIKLKLKAYTTKAKVVRCK